MGILNIGNPGTVSVDGNAYALDNLDCLYIGMGSKDIQFSSLTPEKPARFYLLSYLAHHVYPAALARRADRRVVQG